MTNLEITIPPPPDCSPWCAKEHERDDRWDLVCEHGSGFEAVKWCSKTFAVPTTTSGECEVVVTRFADFISDCEDAATNVDQPEIGIEPYDFTLAQAQQLVEAVRSAMEVAR